MPAQQSCPYQTPVKTPVAVSYIWQIKRKFAK